MLKVTIESYEQAKDCPFRNVLDKLGNKWTFLIFVVLEDGPKRFNQIKRLIGDISQRVLTQNLRDLERDGYISRTVYPASPPKVEYELTDMGRSLLDPVRLFMNWAVEAHPRIREARKKYDSSSTSGR